MRKLRNFSCLLAFYTLSMVDGRLLETSVSCDQNNFILTLNFDVPFQGIVYTEEGFPNCVYVNGSLLSHVSYTLKIPLTGCETKVNSEGNFENGIIVQENAAFLQSSDKKYLLTCIPSASIPNNKFHKKEMLLDFGGVTVESRGSTEVVMGTLPPTDLPASGLNYTVEVRAGHSLNAAAITNALNIGDPISYIVRLQKPVADVQIGRCWANDPRSSLELSDEFGCSLQPRGNIWNSFERIKTDNEVVFINRIKAWAFPTSNEVNIFCNLRVCMSRHCNFSNCTADENNQKDINSQRLRRSGHKQSVSEQPHGFTAGEFSEIQTLRASFRFRRSREKQEFTAPPKSSTKVQQNGAKERYEGTQNGGLLCISTGELFLLTGAVFVFLASTISIFIITICIRRRKSRASAGSFSNSKCDSGYVK